MDISEYRPPSSPPTPSTPPRKDRTKLVMCLILAGTFVGTLGVLSRHELAESVSRHFAKASAPQAQQHIEHKAGGGFSTPLPGDAKQLPSVDQAYASGKSDNRQAQASPFQ